MPQDKSPSVIELLQQVCDIMEERALGEVYLHEGDITLRIRRAGEPVNPYDSRTGMSPSTATASHGMHPNPYSTPKLLQRAGDFLRSPMPGRFYRAPSPEAPPYVESGSVVAEGDTICLIEAMKIFNPLKAEFAFEVLEVLLEDASVVEYDQPLFQIKRL